MPLRKVIHVISTVRVTELGNKPCWDSARTYVKRSCGAELCDNDPTEEEIKALVLEHKLAVIAARLRIEFEVNPVEERTLQD